MKLLTCTGYGNSGSSAATDFFSEFDNVQLVTHLFECTFIHETDGLYDLEQAVEEGHRLKVDLAVKRFMALMERLQWEEYHKYFNGRFLDYTREFLAEAIGCSWKGWWHRAFELQPLSFKQRMIAELANRRFKKLKRQDKYSLYETDSWIPSYLPWITEYYECDVEHFRDCARRYLEKLLSQFNPDNKEYLLIDQLLPPIHAERYLHYFDEVKIIIVDRDPRDYYVCNNLFWANRFLPTQDLDTYIRWYGKTRGATVENVQVKRILLEDLVYDYANTAESLMAFAGLNETQWTAKGQLLKPENSRKNTRIFEKYSNYGEDVGRIASELSHWLFDYTKADPAMLEPIASVKTIQPAMELITRCDAYYAKQHVGVSFVLLVAEKAVKKVLRPLYHKLKGKRS